MKAEKQIRKLLVSKPLLKRPKDLTDHNAYESALTQLDNFAHSQVILEEITQLIYPNKKINKLDFTKFEDLQKAISQTKALYYAHRLCKEEYIYFCLAPIEFFHDSRWTSSYYADRIKPIKTQIEAIKIKYGLKSDEHWPAKKGPREYQRLSKEYDNLFNQTFIEVLREFDLVDLANLKEKYPKKFDKLREHGRRIFHHKDTLPEAIKETIIHYEKEALKASKAGAYLAGVISLGAALEGIFTLMCIQFIDDAKKIYLQLNHKSNRANSNEPNTWSFDTLINVCNKAGWIEVIETENAIFDACKIANYLRKMRNYVHPARQAKDRPWMITDKKEFEFSKSFYIALTFSLNKKYMILD